MSENYYLVMVGKDSFICQIVDEESKLEIDQDKQIIKTINSPFITITNIATIIFNGQELALVPYDKTTFGHKFVTINVNQITEIQFVKDSLISQARMVMSNLVLPK